MYLFIDSATSLSLFYVLQDRDRFDIYYNNFAEIVQEQEKFLSAYLQVIFLRKMKTQQGLDIITRLIFKEQICIDFIGL